MIYVDADQIVRTDLMELMELDLGGAPYGFTPFCDSRTSMEGFRFWKKGYWANHLAGRKYHIRCGVMDGFIFIFLNKSSFGLFCLIFFR